MRPALAGGSAGKPAAQAMVLIAQDREPHNARRRIPMHSFLINAVLILCFASFLGARLSLNSWVARVASGSMRRRVEPKTAAARVH